MVARSEPAEQPLPTARVVDNHGHIVFALCPFCHRTHAHSWRIGTDLQPIRPSHCTPFRPYRLAARRLPAA